MKTSAVVRCSFGKNTFRILVDTWSRSFHLYYCCGPGVLQGDPEAAKRKEGLFAITKLVKIIPYSSLRYVNSAQYDTTWREHRQSAITGGTDTTLSSTHDKDLHGKIRERSMLDTASR